MSTNHTEGTFGVLQNLGASLHEVWKHRGDLFWVFFFSAFFLYAVNIVFGFFHGEDPAFTFYNLSTKSLFLPTYTLDTLLNSSNFNSDGNLIIYLLNIYVVAVLTFLVSRFFLKLERPHSLFSGYFDSLKPLGISCFYVLVTPLFMYSLSILIVSTALGIVVPFGSALLNFFLAGCLALVAVYVLLRFVFVPLCIAMGAGFHSFKMSWRATRGHFFALVTLIFGFCVISSSKVLMDTIAGYLIDFVRSFFSGNLLFSFLNFFESILAVSITFASIIWGLAFLSFVFRSWHK